MSNAFAWIIARLKEPSTWAGIGSIVTAAGFAIRPDLWQEIASVGMGIGGLLAVILNEKPGA